MIILMKKETNVKQLNEIASILKTQNVDTLIIEQEKAISVISSNETDISPNTLSSLPGVERVIAIGSNGVIR